MFVLGFALLLRFVMLGISVVGDARRCVAACCTALVDSTVVAAADAVAYTSSYVCIASACLPSYPLHISYLEYVPGQVHSLFLVCFIDGSREQLLFRRTWDPGNKKEPHDTGTLRAFYDNAFRSLSPGAAE